MAYAANIASMTASTVGRSAMPIELRSAGVNWSSSKMPSSCRTYLVVA